MLLKFFISDLRMASTPKKIKMSDEEKRAIGFLHDVSPVKTSKNNRKYFNATMQTSTGYETVVSFKSEAHKSFMEMASAK